MILCKKLCKDILKLQIALVLLIFPICVIYHYNMQHDVPKLHSEDLIGFTDSNNETGYSHYIIPDIVHLIRFDSTNLTFVDMVNIKSILLNHKPEKIIIHCNCHNLTGKYWDTIKHIPQLKLQYRKKPEHIYGVKISFVQHASDISRIEILQEYGGIYLDNDVFVVKSLHDFRRFEFVINCDKNQYLGTQVIIAHKNARFLKYWHESYRYYHPEKWYYNAGELPSKSILFVLPEFAHTVVGGFGVDTSLVIMLYKERSEEWKKFYTLHLLIHHHYMVPNDRPKIFDENNIKTYNKTYGDMVRSVLGNEI
ncbi:uncharacterized protein [Centruroides vittatus]|uniref:uncharacterized protein n=1 Tax=Centruroides vittatus TaxID=120091 RepID=UPI00350F222E